MPGPESQPVDVFHSFSRRWRAPTVCQALAERGPSGLWGAEAGGAVSLLTGMSRVQRL